MLIKKNGLKNLKKAIKSILKNPSALTEISEQDQEIWQLYQAINTQFVYDFHALPLVFEIFGIQATRMEAQDMLEKLILIHGIVIKDKKPDGQG